MPTPKDKLRRLYDNAREDMPNSFEYEDFDSFENAMKEHTRRKAFYDQISTYYDDDFPAWDDFQTMIGYGPVQDSTHEVAHESSSNGGQQRVGTAKPTFGNGVPFASAQPYSNGRNLNPYGLEPLEKKDKVDTQHSSTIPNPTATNQYQMAGNGGSSSYEYEPSDNDMLTDDNRRELMEYGDILDWFDGKESTGKEHTGGVEGNETYADIEPNKLDENGIPKGYAELMKDPNVSLETKNKIQRRLTGSESKVDGMTGYEEQTGISPDGQWRGMIKVENGDTLVSVKTFDNEDDYNKYRDYLDNKLNNHADLKGENRDESEENADVDSRLRDANAEVKRLDEEIERRKKEINETLYKDKSLEYLSDFDNDLEYGVGNEYPDDELQMLLAARHQAKQRVKVLEREKKKPNFFQTVLKGLFSLDVWDFGISSLRDQFMLGKSDKAREGNAEEARQSMLENEYDLARAEADYSENDTFWQRAGDITAQALPFVGEFLLTGGFSAIAKGGTKLGAKLAIKLGLNRGNSVARRLAYYTVKNTGTLVGDLTASLVMSSTTGSARTASDALERHRGKYVKTQDGDLVFAKGVEWNEAIRKAVTANMLEYYTEMLGGHMDGLVSGFGRFIDKKTGKTHVADFLERVTESEWNQLLRKGGVNEVPGEVLEEEANIVLNSLFVGDNKMSDLVDPKTQLDIIGGMFLSIGFMKSPSIAKAGYDKVQYERYKSKTDKADKEAESLIGDKWSDIRDKIDVATNDEIAGVVNDEVYNNNNLTDEEKKAAIEYYTNLMQMRGFNLRAAAKARDEISKIGSEVESEDPAVQAQANQDAFTKAEVAEQNATANPTEENKKAAEEARAETEQVVRKIADNANDEAGLEEMRQNNKRHVSGNIMPVKLKNDDEGEWYVKDGNVVMTADGSMVDKEQSDREIVVFNAKTGETKMIDPTGQMGVESMGNVVTPEQQAAQVEQVRESVRQQLTDDAQGKVTLRPGDTYTLPDGNVAHIMAVDGNQVTFSVNGKIFSRSMDELQGDADAIRQEAYREENNIPQQFNGAPDEYKNGMNIVVDQNGEKAPAVVVRTLTEDGVEKVVVKNEDGSVSKVPVDELNGKVSSYTEKKNVVLPNGMIEGVPDAYENGMEVTIKDENGEDVAAVVMRRVSWKNGEFVEDENGNIIEYLMDGEVRHKSLDEMNESIVAYQGKEEVAPVEEKAEDMPSGKEEVAVEENPTAEAVETAKKQEVEKPAEKAEEDEKVEAEEKENEVEAGLKENGNAEISTEVKKEESSAENVEKAKGEENNGDVQIDAGRVPASIPVTESAKVEPVEIPVDKNGNKDYTGVPSRQAYEDIKNDVGDYTEEAIRGELDTAVKEREKVDKMKVNGIAKAKEKKEAAEKAEAKVKMWESILAEHEAEQTRIAEAERAEAERQEEEARRAEERRLAERSEEEVEAEYEAKMNEEKDRLDDEYHKRQEILEKAKNSEVKAEKAKEIYGEKFDDNFEHPYSVEELVSIAFPNVKILWDGSEKGVDGLKQAVGSNMGRKSEFGGFNSVIAKDGQGIPFWDFVHRIYENDVNQGENGYPLYGESEIGNALIDMFRNAKAPRDIRDYAVNNRIDLAERAINDEENRYLDGIDDERRYFKLVARENELERRERELFGEHLDELAKEVGEMSEEEYIDMINKEHEDYMRSLDALEEAEVKESNHKTETENDDSRTETSDDEGRGQDSDRETEKAEDVEDGDAEGGIGREPEVEEGSRDTAEHGGRDEGVEGEGSSARESDGVMSGVVEDDGRGSNAVKALEEAYRSGDKTEIKKAVDEIKNLYEQGVNIKFEDEDVDADELEDYEGSDPKMLAEQYAVRLARHLFSDDDADLGYIESGIKSDVAKKQKADGTAKEVGEAQRMMTEALVSHLNGFGVPISADVEEGQRMLDEVNGRGIVLSKGKKRALETASLAENEQDQPTVVSSADGAKIRQNLESIKKDFENLSNYPKYFIGEIAKALGAVKHGSNSQYATFETANGKIVTIRLADHNAKVSTFDNHDESEGISIVITPKANNGVTNDGKAHVVEFFYDAIKLRKAEGKPLVDIISSIEQALYSGEFKDKTGLAERTEVNAAEIQMHKADESAPVYYSNAYRAVEGIKQEKATPEQWLAMLQKNGGLKAGEDKWIGLSEWLKGQDKKSLTKQEVMDYIAENTIQIEEEEYGSLEPSEIENNEIMKELQAEFDKLIAEKDGSAPSAFQAMIDRYGEDFDLGFTYDGERLEPVYEYDGLSGYARYYLGIDEKPIDDTRLNYTTEGLENKREIALVVPTVEPYNESDEVHFGDAGNGRAVAWARFGDATDADGKRVLVIDEIQSKRHQDGRENGYSSEREFKKYRKEMEEKYGQAFISEMTKEESDKYLSLSGDVPDAPFDKNWHELAMKRMLRYAAENGYDKVAWTTGTQQAKRYDLSKKLDAIEYFKNEDGTYFASYILNGRNDGHTVGSKLTEKELVDNFGKEIADRIVNGEKSREREAKSLFGNKSRSLNVLEGDNLTIGGEGMKGFYDQMLPKFMDKYGKKWGVKTGEVELDLPNEADRVMHSVDVTPEMKESVMDGQPMFFKTENGEVYGYVLDGKIYIDPRIATAETPIHEYTHLWTESLRKANPKAWEQLKKLMAQETDLMDYVKKKYPELANNEDALMDEVFAHYSGKRGKERLDAEMNEEMDKANGVLEKANVATIFGKIKAALDMFWNMARDLFAGSVKGLNKMKAEDFADMAMNDLLNGFNPKKNNGVPASEQKTMMGMHNISEDIKFQKVDDAGAAGVTDRQGNPIDNDGKLIVEKVDSISDLTDEDFTRPTRSVQLPELPKVVDDAIGANGKPVVIKKNIFEKNLRDHSDVTPENSRDILISALYNADLYGQNQKMSKPYNWIVVNVKESGKNKLVLLEVSDKKDNVEIVHWHYLRDSALETIKRQAEREGGRILILPSLDEEAGGLSSLTNGLSSSDKITNISETDQKNVAESADTMEQKRDAVRDMGNRLNTNVRIITDAKELEGATEKQKSAKGWFNVRTGDVVINLANCESVEDAVATMGHETIGHKGMRELLGDNYDAFLDEVYNHLNGELKSRVDQKAGRMFVDDMEAGYDAKRRVAVDELFGEMAEKPFEEFTAEEQTLWQKLKQTVREWLDKLLGGAKLPKWFEIGDNEMRYMLWRSKENLERGKENYVDMARDVAMREELGLDGAGDDIRYRDVVDTTDKVAARESYERMLSSSRHQFSEAMQDSMLSLKKLYQAILGKDTRIEDVSDRENAYLAENRMSSMSASQIDVWNKYFMKPIIEAVHKLTKGQKDAYDALTDYMMAKHGLERNDVMARRDASKKYDEETAKGNTTDLNALISQYRQNDYAGLTALTGEADVADAEAVAKKMVDDYEASHDTKDIDSLWDNIGKATRESLKKSFTSGMMSYERYQEILNMYQYYIPLQGFDKKVAEETYAYLGSDGTLGYGTPIRAAKGRKSKADDPIATIQMNGEASIRQGNRNGMKQRFLNFVQNHPSDLVSVQDVWLKKNDVTGEWEQYSDAGINDNDSPEEVERKTREFTEKMEGLSKSDPEHYKRSRENPNIPYRVVESRDKNQHQVKVSVNGKSYILTINGNPRAAQALNGLTNPNVQTEGSFGQVLNLGERLNRWLAPIYTTLNPEFMVSNFLRDAIYANTITWVKEDPNYAIRFNYNFGKLNPVKLGKLYKAWGNGSIRNFATSPAAMGNNLTEDEQTQLYFYEFMMNGGETGWTNLRDIEKHKKEIEKMLKSERNKTKRAVKAIGSAYELANKSIENCARFAAFVTSRNMGRSVGRSIWDSKEISVNFNKKGAADKFLSSNGQTWIGNAASFVSGFGRGAYLFWNASVQGVKNVLGAAQKHPGRFTALASSLFVMGLMQSILSQLIGDDDDNEYYNLPEYKRRSNIIFSLGDNKWVTIPLSQEYRCIFGLGELAGGLLTGQEHYSDAELAKQFASQLSQAMPIDFLEGKGGLYALVPTVAAPLVDVYENVGWSGLPIHRSETFRENDPQWTLAYPSANKQILEATKFLNESTGGSDVTKGSIDLNPADIEYLANQYLGGPFSMLNKMQKLGETIMGKRETNVNNIPLVSRVMYEGDERTKMRKVNNQYFNLLKEYGKTKHDLKKMDAEAKSGREDYVKYAERIDKLNNSKEYGRYLIMDMYKEKIDVLRSLEKEENKLDTEKLKEYEDILKKECVDMINAYNRGDVEEPTQDEKADLTDKFRDQMIELRSGE